MTIRTGSVLRGRVNFDLVVARDAEEKMVFCNEAIPGTSGVSRGAEDGLMDGWADGERLPPSMELRGTEMALTESALGDLID